MKLVDLCTAENLTNNPIIWIRIKTLDKSTFSKWINFWGTKLLNEELLVNHVDQDVFALKCNLRINLYIDIEKPTIAYSAFLHKSIQNNNSDI